MTLLLVLVALLPLRPCFADWSAVSYSSPNGKTTFTGGNPPRAPKAYGPIAPSNFGAGGALTGYGSVDCAGAITATFTWTGGDLPKCVIVKETCSVSFDGASGSCSDGLGGATHTSPGSYEKVRYSVRKNPPASLSLDSVSPSAHGERPSTDFDTGCTAGVNYKAELIDPEIVLGGGIGPSNAKRYLIGQQVVATLSTPGLTQTSWSWDVLGGEAFKNWTANQTTATFTPLGIESASSLTFYFKKPEDDGAKVTCFAHLDVPAGSLPADGLDVSLERECGVEKPIPFTMVVHIGQVELVGNPPAGIVFEGYTPTPNPYPRTLGIAWDSSVTTPQILPELEAAVGTSRKSLRPIEAASVKALPKK